MGCLKLPYYEKEDAPNFLGLWKKSDGPEKISNYYPFGLVMDGREIDDEPYKYGYQGQFAEKDTTTGWSEFKLRFYDAKIARWLSADPYGQYYSPYVAMGNTPHMSIDADGGFATDPIVKSFGMWAVTESTHQLAHIAIGSILLNGITVGVERGISLSSSASGILGSVGRISAYDAVSQYSRQALYTPIQIKPVDTGQLTNFNPPQFDGPWINNSTGFNPPGQTGVNNLPGYLLTGVGTLLTGGETRMFNSNSWYSLRQMKPYSHRFNGNQYTGGKLAARNTATGLKIAGYGLGAYNAVNIELQYSSGQISGWQRLTEQSSNLFSTFGGLHGAAWGVGWETGRAITNIHGYKVWKQNKWLPWRKQNLGY